MPVADKNKLVLVLLFLLYVVVFTIFIALISGPFLSLTKLQFFFGPEVQRILSGQPIDYANRLPFVPYLLAALSLVSDIQLPALFIKNFLIQSLLAAVLYQWWRRPLLYPIAPILTLYVLFFPQVVRHGFSLIPEEGYLIALLALLFHGMLEAPRIDRIVSFVPYAAACAIVYLTKGSMLLFAPAMCLLYYYRSRRFGVLILFVSLLAAAMLLWGMTTLNHTGRFSLTTSAAGYEIWKGNNARTLEFYPHGQIDNLSGEAPARRAGENQWDWSRRCRNEAISFLLSEPGVAGKLLLVRLYKAFFSFIPEQSPSWSSSRFGYIRPFLKPVGVVYMLIFRIMFLAALAYSIYAIARKEKHSDERTAAIGYLAFVASFITPFLIAFSTERHIIPLVIPTVLYTLYVLQQDDSLRDNFRDRWRRMNAKTNRK